MAILRWLAIIATLLITLTACSKQQSPAPVRGAGMQAPTVRTAPPPQVEVVEEAGHPNIPPPAGDVVIGVLLPLSGPHAEIGTQLRDAALMGLFDKLNSLSSLEVTRNPRLLIKDTAGDPTKTKEMTKVLLDKDAQIILGPLLSDNVEAAKTVTKNTPIPIIAFSNDHRVAGNNTYVFGFQSGEQVERIANFAATQRIEHFAALAPQTTYGRLVVGQFSDIVKGRGYSLQPVNFFAEGQLPPAPVLNRIVNEAREWGEKRKGIFLPMTGQSLAAIATRLMSDPDINPAYLKLMGTGVWDDEQVLRIPALQGAWFATSHPKAAKRFSDQYAKTYGKTPSRIASLSYDAVALLATLALQHPEHPFSSRILNDPNGFRGPANGIFRFTPEGTVERALAVVELTPYGFQVIDQAPTSFMR